MNPPKFKIRNHLLEHDNGTNVPFNRSPNQRGTLDPKYLIMHYTAGRSAESSVNWLTDKDSRASAHLVIGRDGNITQLVAFNRRAWHAGESEWNGLSGMNSHSIGIELDNAGKLTHRSNKWYSWFNESYPEEEVVGAVHKHENSLAGWHTFTSVQLEVAVGVSVAIVQKYRLKDMLGHDDISPGRKVDPGPAFPMMSVKSKVMGRIIDEPDLFKTIESLNIRLGPGTEFEKLSMSPLPKGTQVLIIDTNGVWKFVEVLDDLEHEGCGIRGWVSGRYLRHHQIPL